jgi:hypothetical protein
MRNIYFELTDEFNRHGTIAVLPSGQAVVYFRTALMSKDGDWVLRETPEACSRILEVLGGRGARYRAGAPLDVRWLSGGWSSHFEFQDEKSRRVRCDFLARPPRLSSSAIASLLEKRPEPGQPNVIDLKNLILMKQTQRAKDYPVIGELSRLLPPEQEILYTTDPDRILELAPKHGQGVDRLSIKEALRGGSKEDVVVALAREVNALQEADRRRLQRYEQASTDYLARLVRSGLLEKPLLEAHPEVIRLAERHLPCHLSRGSESEPLR